MKHFKSWLFSCPLGMINHFLWSQTVCCFLTSLISVSLPQSRKSEGRSYHLHWLSSPAGIFDLPADVIEAWLIISILQTMLLFHGKLSTWDSVCILKGHLLLFSKLVTISILSFAKTLGKPRRRHILKPVFEDRHQYM